MDITLYLFIGASLLLLSVLSSKLSLRFGVPSLLIFLGIGIIFGSDVLNVVYLEDYELAQTLAIIALIYILFSGGLDTKWTRIQPVVVPGLLLSTLGVLISAFTVGGLAFLVLDISFAEAVLLGAVISSTDAAAVFSILRTQSIGLRSRLQELIEFESGTNDPMAIFLTIGIIQYLTMPDATWMSFVLLFVMQIFIGLAAGILFGKLVLWLLNHINLGYDGLYPVLSLSFVPLIYASTDLVGGSGFLAVYLAGMVLNNGNFVHRKSLMNFFDGIGWLMQISMFLVLGLLVFPTEILAISGKGLIIALALILVGRPVSVFLATAFTRLDFRAKLFVSWVGLRGAVPIILATFPLVAGLPQAELFFSIVFFVVVTSAIIQGTTISYFARWLKVKRPVENITRYPIELESSVRSSAKLVEVKIEVGDFADGKQVFEIKLPKNVLITLVNRDSKFFIPQGSSILRGGDSLQILTETENIPEITKLFKEGPGAEGSDGEITESLDSR